VNYTMYVQTQVDKIAKAEFERGLAEGTAAASTKATAEFERGRTEGFAAGVAAELARTKTPAITKEQGEAAMAEVKSLQASAAVDGDPVALATKLRTHVAAEAAKGRRISLTQASAEIANAK
jgi:hypothetical protein